MEHELGLDIPDYALLPSGLWAPVDVAAEQVDVLPAAIRGLTPRPRLPVFVRSRTPAPIDAIQVWIDEAQLGVDSTDIEELVQLVRGVPFAESARFIAWVLRRLSTCQRDLHAQLELSRGIFTAHRWVPGAMARVAGNQPRRLPFAETLLVPLLRLLIEEAPTELRDGGPLQTQVRLERLVLGAPAALDPWTCRIGPGMESTDLLGFFMMRSTFLRGQPRLPELARQFRLFELMEEPHSARVEAERCDVQQAMIDAYGLTAGEQLALGFALAAQMHLWDDDGPNTNICRLVPGAFEDLARRIGLGQKVETARALVSMTRAEFAASFEGLDPSRDNLASNFVPFQQRPFLALPDGSLVLTSPWFLGEWITSGMHYRALDAVAGSPRDRSRSARYLRFSGHIFERYCVELAESAHAPLPTGLGVRGDFTYESPKGESRSPDLLIQDGADLIAIEVEHHRPSLKVTVDGDLEAAALDVRDHLDEKVRSLTRFAEWVHAEKRSTIVPGLALHRVRRIWPVVVGVEVPAQQPPLWAYLERDSLPALRQIGAEPLTLLDAEDFEVLIGIVEGGASLLSVLREKCRPEYRNLELSVYLNDHPRAPAPRHPTASQEALSRMLAPLAASLRSADGAD